MPSYFEDVITSLSTFEEETDEVGAMVLGASSRLLYAEAEPITFAQYCEAVSRVDPSYVAAGFDLPAVLKNFYDELKAIATTLKETSDVAWEHIVQAFKEKSIFTLLKGVGFSLKKLMHALALTVKFPSAVIGHFLDAVIKAFGDAETFKKLNPKARLAKLDEVVSKYPAIKHLTGPVVAGFLIWMYLHSSATGNPAKDLDLVDSVVACIKGNFSLEDLFASPAGVQALALLAFGLATGGAGLLDYGFSHAHKALAFLEQNTYNLLLSLFYKGASKTHEHLKTRYPAVFSSIILLHPQATRRGRNQDWFDRMTAEEKQRYRKDNPGTRFVKPHGIST